MENNKLNIAIACDPVTDYLAGSFASTRRFSQLLIARGHKVIFLASRSPKNRADSTANGIKTYRFRSLYLPKTEGQFYIAFPTPREIEKILAAEKIDVVHAMIPTPVSVIALRAAKKLGIPGVAHSHTQPENLFLHLPKWKIVNILNDIFYKYLIWVYGQADALIYPSAFARGLFQRLNPEKPTQVISNGVNRERYRPLDPSPFMSKYGLDPAKKHLLFVGRLHPEKSVDTLIRSMPDIIKRHPDAYLSIVGFGHQENEMRALIDKLKLENHIKLCGLVPDELMPAAFNSGLIFILPSLAELEGMVVLEAMSCGKPLVVANSSNSASVHFVQGNGSLFEPENAADLAAKVNALLDSPGERERMGKVSLELSKQYDINKSVDDLIALYNKLKNERILLKSTQPLL